jgi:catechol 2,3-dioxygenase-like lactoylglutathione lyase family enzyme
MLQVQDVAGSRSWYDRVVGLRSGHEGDEFDMLFAGDDFVWQLHRHDAEEHRIPHGAPGGDSGGITLGSRPRTGTESTVLDPDGYIVVLHSPFGPG